MINNFYKSTSLQQLFKKSQFTIFAITFLISTLTLVSISVLTVESSAKQSLQLISQTAAERIQPALVFNDRVTISKILIEYTNDYHIRYIGLYDQKQNLLAKSQKDNDYYYPLQALFDRIFLSEAIEVPVYHLGKNIGTVVVYGSSAQILSFIIKVFFGLMVGILFILFTLAKSVNSTYRFIMQSISPLIQIAHLINQQNAYNLRFPQNDIKEFNELNMVFNHLLEEIQAWNTHLQNENHALSHQALHDYLTELPNRNYFYQELSKLFSRIPPAPSALIYVDNNNFKQINDEYGHVIGDEVLKETARRLKHNIRQTDFVARLGGDEFAIILHDMTRVDQLTSIAENLIQCCEEPLIHNGQIISFSFSLGISISINAADAKELIMQADQAMYQAKSLKHHWCIYQK